MRRDYLVLESDVCVNGGLTEQAPREWKVTLYGSSSPNCCAYCNHHKRAVTVRQMKKKECLKKECKHLIKNEYHEIWKQRERRKQKRKERKMHFSAIGERNEFAVLG